MLNTVPGFSTSHLKSQHPTLDTGVMPIMTYGGFKRMTGFCKTHVPKDIEEALESIKDNDEAVKNFGIDLGTRMCKRILDSGTPGLHMYTLNTERSSVAILENLGLINKSQVGHLSVCVQSCELCRMHSLPGFCNDTYIAHDDTLSALLFYLLCGDHHLACFISGFVSLMQL